MKKVKCLDTICARLMQDRVSLAPGRGIYVTLQRIQDPILFERLQTFKIEVKYMYSVVFFLLFLYLFFFFGKLLFLEP